MKRIITIIYCLSFTFLLFSQSFSQATNAIYPFSTRYNPELNLLRVFPTPEGYERYPENKMTLFQAWVTNLPLLPQAMPVTRWDGAIVMKSDSIGGVIDFGIGANYQKDPDIPMQMIMEYLRATNSLGDYPFVISQKDTLTFNKWLNGKYEFDSRMNLQYRPDSSRPGSEKEYYRFISLVLTYIGARNLLLNVTPIDEKDIDPGTMYIQFKDDRDSLGHTAVILDVCSNAKGERLFLAGWGGTPACSFAVYRPYPLSERTWFTMDELKSRLKEYGPGQFYRYKK